VVTVNLSAPFGQLSGPLQVLAVEQVVFTVVAETTPATGVLFEVSGIPIDVPLSDGRQVSTPVYPWAYLAPATPVGAGTSTSTTTSTAAAP
jgi:hypothetical protein